MAVLDHDHSHSSANPWTHGRMRSSKDQSAVLGFLVFWLAFFGLVWAINYVVGWLF